MTGAAAWRRGRAIARLAIRLERLFGDGSECLVDVVFMFASAKKDSEGALVRPVAAGAMSTPDASLNEQPDLTGYASAMVLSDVR